MLNFIRETKSLGYLHYDLDNGAEKSIIIIYAKCNGIFLFYVLLYLLPYLTRYSNVF